MSETPPSIGHRIVTQTIAKRLAELFPKATNVDFDVAAADLAEAVEGTTIAHITAREDALQETMRGLMTYYADLLRDLQVRIAVLEQERASLKAKLNRREDLGELQAVSR